MKRFCAKLIFWLIYTIWISFSTFWCFALDDNSYGLLNTAYWGSDTNKYVLKVDWKKMVDWDSSMLIRLSKLLLRMTSVLWVTMFMYGWVLFVMSFGEQGKMQAARKKLVYAGIWIFVALSSIALINLIQSMTVSTISEAINATN